MTPLPLPGDAAIAAPTLEAHLEARGADPALSALACAIAHAAAPIAARLALAALPGDPARIVGTNDSGDRQKALDRAAHEHLLEALARADVRAVVSEEAVGEISLHPEGRFDVAIDPIDGSGSIGIGAPLGLLFCVFEAGETPKRPGADIVAAGYVSFGHSTDMGLSFGAGVDLFTLEPASGRFRLAHERVRIPESKPMIAHNASNTGHWPALLRDHVESRIAAGANMRWIAAAVGDLHRILLQGGIFLYPADRRKGYENGRLRLLYEAFPIAFLIEQAGGAATDGANRILDRTPESLHQHCPLIFGDREMVAAIPRH